MLSGDPYTIKMCKNSNIMAIEDCHTVFNTRLTSSQGTLLKVWPNVRLVSGIIENELNYGVETQGETKERERER